MVGPKGTPCQDQLLVLAFSSSSVENTGEPAGPTNGVEENKGHYPEGKGRDHTKPAEPMGGVEEKKGQDPEDEERDDPKPAEHMNVVEEKKDQDPEGEVRDHGGCSWLVPLWRK